MRETIANNRRISSDFEGLTAYMTDYLGFHLNTEEMRLEAKESDVDVYKAEINKTRLTKWQCVLNLGPVITVQSVREIVRGETRPVRDQWIEPFQAPQAVQDWLGIDQQHIKVDKPILGYGSVTLADIESNPDARLKGTILTFHVNLPYTVRGIRLYADVEGMEGDGPWEDLEFPVLHTDLERAMQSVSEKATELWHEFNPGE